MPSTIAVVTHPLAFCAYVLFLIFGLAASKQKNRQHFSWAAVFMAFVALAGGLSLAWRQVEKSMPTETASAKSDGTIAKAPASIPEPTIAPPTRKATNHSIQTSLAAQSPNVSDVSGNVGIRYGSPVAGNSEGLEKKK